jgi:hypothetical protein
MRDSMTETDTELLEVFITKNEHFPDCPPGGAIVVLPGQNISGELFSESVECTLDYGGDLLLLHLSWSPSRAGSEKIPYTTLDGKPIEVKDHPLYGTKNEQEGLYHPTLPAGCYVLRGVKAI